MPAYTLDIETKKKREHFCLKIYRPESLDFQPLEVRSQNRHLLLLANHRPGLQLFQQQEDEIYRFVLKMAHKTARPIQHNHRDSQKLASLPWKYYVAQTTWQSVLAAVHSFA